ncbi:MAG TPA: hypothetical protein VFK44_06950 [Bacillales bacterium]|nr:hypothetical protein [Bacillales bacterium]
MAYALHETLEVHEMAAFKTVGLTKAKTMRALVSDDELKRIMKEDIEVSTRQLQDLSEILAKAKRR